MGKLLVLGTRGSQLALTQSRWVANLITGHQIDLKVIETAGDDLSISIFNPVIPGAFVNALRAALLKGEVDFLVHSLKDLPSIPHPELTIAAIPIREDSREVLVSTGNQLFVDLNPGSRIGTSSPRRSATISRLNSELLPEPIRGNVDSRIEKVRSGEYDAVVLAAAGLARISRLNEVAQYFELDVFIPAPAQGALAVECRSDDRELISLLKELDDPLSRMTATAERAVLQGLQAGCEIAIGATAQVDNGQLTLTAELGGSLGIPSQKFSLSSAVRSDFDLVAAQALGLQLADLFVR